MYDPVISNSIHIQKLEIRVKTLEELIEILIKENNLKGKADAKED